MTILAPGEQQALRRSLQRYLDEKVYPRVQEWEDDEQFPWEILRGLADFGIFEGGGQRLPLAVRAELYEELGHAYRGLNLVVDHAVVWGALDRHGAPELVERWRASLAAGEALAILAIPPSLTDHGGAGVVSTAAEKGTSWTLSGRLSAVLAGGIGDVALVAAQIDARPGSELGVFLVPVAEGCSVISLGASLAYPAAGMAEIEFPDVEVDSDALIARGAGAHELLNAVLAESQVGHSAFAAGAARRALELATTYAGVREQFGRPLGQFQAIQMKLADIAADVELARSSVVRAARTARLADAVTAKIVATDASFRAAERALEIHGGYGYMREYQVERLLREARSDQVLWGENRRVVQDLVSLTESSRSTHPEDQVEAALWQFLQDEVRPLIPLMESGHYPESLIKGLGELGVLGLSASHMGTSISRRERLPIYEAMGYVYRPLTSILIHNMVVEILDRFGTRDQREEWLPQLTSGEVWTAFGMTEPEAGSDASAMRTTAKRVDGGYVLNGEKIFISQADRAGLTLIAAKVGEGDIGQRSISVFLVDRDSPGFTVPRVEKKMGYWAHHTCHVLLDDVFVPDNRRLGDEGRGFPMLMSVLSGCRIDMAALSIGAASAAYDLVVEHSRDVAAHASGPMMSSAADRTDLGAMLLDIQSSRSLVIEAAVAHDRGDADPRGASQAKVVATDMNVRVCAEAVGILGPAGLLRKHDVERLFRESKLDQIGLGTNDIQRLTIAKSLLKASS